MVEPTLTAILGHYLPAMTGAVLLWLLLFGQEVLRGRISVRSLLVLTALLAIALAASGFPPNG